MNRPGFYLALLVVACAARCAGEVVIRMPDGRRFKAAFELRTGRLHER